MPLEGSVNFRENPDGGYFVDFELPSGPKGLKGDPGGWVKATIIYSDTDVDKIVTAGLYYYGGGATNLSISHYPVDNTAGSLEVIDGDVTIIQRFTTNLANVYTRRRFGTSWSPWREFMAGGPGNRTQGSLLSTVDLNTIQTDGIYRQDNGNNATTVTNYPVNLVPGILTVSVRHATSILQEFVLATNSDVYRRWLNGTTWSPWVVTKNGGPGNLVTGDSLGTADLNAVQATGVYRQTDVGGTVGTTARNYPYMGAYGVLTVQLTNGTDVTQTFLPQSYNLSLDAQLFYIRNRSNGNWSPWRAFKSGGAGNLIKPDLISNTADLNTLTTDGRYVVDGGTGIVNKPSNLAQEYGIVEVITSNSSGRLVQFFYPTASSQSGKLYWIRSYVGGVWTPWREVTTKRTDKTAGIAIYDWDPVLNREQIVYGDTGWRDISSSLVNGWTLGSGGGLFIRRLGSQVHLRIYNLVSTSATSTTFLELPSGFGQGVGGDSYLLVPNNATGMVLVRMIAGSVRQFAVPTLAAHFTGAYSNFPSWTTVDPWPTALPGVASGSIPNL